MVVQSFFHTSCFLLMQLPLAWPRKKGVPEMKRNQLEVDKMDGWDFTAEVSVTWRQCEATDGLHFKLKGKAVYSCEPVPLLSQCTLSVRLLTLSPGVKANRREAASHFTSSFCSPFPRILFPETYFLFAALKVKCSTV